MKITLSQQMRDTIQKVQRKAKSSGFMLDIYSAAKDVQATLPDENIALEDIVAVLLLDDGSKFGAFEFDLRGTVIEIVINLPDKDGDQESQQAA